MEKVIVKSEIITGNVKTFNRYFHDCKLARAFAKEQGTKVIKVEDNRIAAAKGKYLVQYQKVVKS